MNAALSYVSAALFAAWRLARRDVAAMRLFDLTVAGFWRSFGAILVAAPAFIFITALENHLLVSADREPPPAFLNVADYVLGWIVFPLVMLAVCKFLDLGTRYATYIIAMNWARVLIIGLFVLVYAILVIPMLGVTLGAIAWLVIWAAVLYYQWFIAKTALGTPTGTAIAIVVLQNVLDVAIEAGVFFAYARLS
jgi:hypothetical protein